LTVLEVENAARYPPHRRFSCRSDQEADFSRRTPGRGNPSRRPDGSRNAVKEFPAFRESPEEKGKDGRGDAVRQTVRVSASGKVQVMFPVTCRNCGALNLFTGPPPARVKCETCGNHFRTDRGPAPTPARQDRRRSRLRPSHDAASDFEMVRERLGAMYPVICTQCHGVNLILSPPPAQATCDHCHRVFAALQEADLEVQEAYELWKSHRASAPLAPLAPASESRGGMVVATVFYIILLFVLLFVFGGIPAIMGWRENPVFAAIWGLGSLLLFIIGCVQLIKNRRRP
jgi:ribosomal protein S27E